MRDTITHIQYQRQAIEQRRINVDFLAQPKVEVSQALLGAEEPVMVETDAQLEGMSGRLKSSRIIGLDTEFVRERTYRAALGLLQLSDGETAWLIDPLALDNLDPLNALLSNKEIIKVIHSGSEDFEVIHNTLGVVPTSVIDSQIACAMLGQSLQLGYHHAVKWLFDVEVEKDQTRSNWLKRPLTTAQCRYAALDVVLLPLMAEQLTERLNTLDRGAWLGEEVRRMAQNSTSSVDPKNAWQRIRGAGTLDKHALKSLQALAAWREETADRKNLARGFVVKDSSLIAIARLQPTDMGDFAAIEDLHPKAIDRYGKKWIQLVREASQGQEIKPLPQLDHSHKNLMKTMRNFVSDKASELDVDAALLASRKQLENLVLMYEEVGEVPERFSGWRQDVITSDLLEIIEGR